MSLNSTGMIVCQKGSGVGHLVDEDDHRQYQQLSGEVTLQDVFPRKKRGNVWEYWKWNLEQQMHGRAMTLRDVGVWSIEWRCCRSQTACIEGSTEAWPLLWGWTNTSWQCEVTFPICFLAAIRASLSELLCPRQFQRGRLCLWVKAAGACPFCQPLSIVSWPNFFQMYECPCGATRSHPCSLASWQRPGSLYHVYT